MRSFMLMCFVICSFQAMADVIEPVGHVRIKVVDLIKKKCKDEPVQIDPRLCIDALTNCFNTTFRHGYGYVNLTESKKALRALYECINGK